MQQGDDMQSEKMQQRERRYRSVRTSTAVVGVCGILALGPLGCTSGVSGGDKMPDGSSGSPTGGSSGTQGSSVGGAGSTAGSGTGSGSGTQGTSAGTNASTTSPIVDPPNEDAAPMSLAGDQIYTSFVRLTNSQWEHAVQDILALPEAPRASTFEVPVACTTDFPNNEHVLTVSSGLAEDYQFAAE